MRFVRHFVEWHGERYIVEPLKSFSRITARSPIWAVFRRGEFIGTLPYRLNETVEELEGRCTDWLTDLFESPQPRVYQ